MFKSLALSIKGFLRGKVEEATDLRHASKEHFHQINGSIEEVRAERNRIAGRGILLEKEIENLEATVEKTLQAVRHWAAVGNIEFRDRSHAEYTRAQTELNQKKSDLTDIQDQVSSLDAQIKQLENDTNAAKNNIGKAATRQTVARATNKVENIHDNLRAGPLSGVVETANESAAYAEARRRERNANDNSDLFAYQTANNVLSLDEILRNGSSTTPLQNSTKTVYDTNKPHAHCDTPRLTSDDDTNKTRHSADTTSHHHHTSHSDHSSSDSSSVSSDSSSGGSCVD